MGRESFMHGAASSSWKSGTVHLFQESFLAVDPETPE